MKRSTLLTLALLIAAPGARVALAQEEAPPTPRANRPAQTKQAPTPKPTKPPAKTQVRPAPAPEATPQPDDQSGVVILKLERGGKLAVSNRVGRITITGWDRDTLEARATSETGSEPLQVQVGGEPGRAKISLGVTSLDPRRPNAGREVDLEVKLPRYADIETVESRRGDVEVSNVDGTVAINSSNGNINVSRVGVLKINLRSGDIFAQEIKGDFTARTSNGDVTVDGVGGLVDVASTQGSMVVRNASGDVRSNSASGDINVQCARGRAEVNTASGSIMLLGIGGDVEANTASGDVTFKGVIRGNGRYRLKSISGIVEMAIQPDAPGFTATLITYSGEIETDFALKVDSPLQGGPINRRITGRYGDGQAQMTLDSFSGSVSILKGVAGPPRECK